MTLTDADKRTVLCVFDSLLTKKTEDELNTFLGSETIREMHTLYRTLLYSDYCEEHGISLEEMTPEDYEEHYNQTHPIYD